MTSTGPLLLEVAPFTDADHWRWVLKDAAGAFLADHAVALDPSAAEYEAMRDLRAYLRRRAAPDRRLQDETRLMDDVGRWLGRELLGPIADRLVEHAPTTVRVTVPKTAERLLFLPLEAAWGGGQSLTRQEVSYVFDVHEGAGSPTARAVRERLRVLALFSLPVDQPALALRRERHALKRLLHRLARTHQLGIELRVLQYGVTRQALEQIVDEGWDILHFSGHGLPANLVLEKADATADLVSMADLVKLLRPTRDRIKLVILSACLSAAPVEETLQRLGLRPAGQTPGQNETSGPREDAPASVAVALVRALDSAVLAMRYPVIDDFAIALGSELYERLLGRHQPLTRALQQALPRALGDVPRPQVPPLSVATPALFGRRALDLTLEAPARTSDFVVSEAGFAYFPDEPERFVGRVRELSEARRVLSPESAQRGVVFHGMAGAGKTTCALELAYGYEAGRFEAFVWHKAPDQGTDIDGALVAFALDLEKQLPGFAMTQVVDHAELLRTWLPRLTQLLEDRSILLVLDNLESLLTPDGRWRDDRWGDVVGALLGHAGLSRTVVTSRIRPAGLDEQRVLIRAIHALSLSEQVLQARELPHLGTLLRGETAYGERGADLVVRVLKETQGHPALLVLADGQAADPERLASQLETVEAVPATNQGAGDIYLREGHSPLSDHGFLRKLEEWTRMVAGPLPAPSATLFHALCALEEDDRLSWVVEANWSDIWQRLGREGEPPAIGPALMRLAEVALIEVQALGDKHDRYRLHPGVAEAGRAEAGPELQAAVDNQLAAFWQAVLRAAEEHEQRGGGGLLVQAARNAVPYLLRRHEWGPASLLLEQVMGRDESLATLAWMLPLLRRVAEATRGTERELVDRGLLARALNRSGRTQAAESLLRELVDRSAASGQAGLESSLLGELSNLLLGTGRLREALALVDRKKDAAQRAGLGPWTQLGDEGRRLNILGMLGDDESVLVAVEDLRAQMSALPEYSEQPERINPWNVREVILDTGRGAAVRLQRWEQALALNTETVALTEARGAPAREVARTRFNNYSPLLRLGRFGEVRALLEWCRAVFENEQDLEGLRAVFSALADLEDELGRHVQAVEFEKMGLRYAYALWDPRGCSVSHHNLSNYLERGGGERWVALAHRLAGGVIRWQSADGLLRTTVGMLATNVAEFTPSRPPFPETFDRLCAVVEQVEGVRLRELFERLPHRAPDGDEALRAVLRMAQELADTT
ncbi:MAG TPA: CHAT domain-containing protein [Chloroflexota bacterium]|nr:CHAT domain-containing protein [Chloroflexota bacterium]